MSSETTFEKIIKVGEKVRKLEDALNTISNMTNDQLINSAKRTAFEALGVRPVPVCGDCIHINHTHCTKWAQSRLRSDTACGDYETNLFFNQ
jgi:hypothetical protein